jgi:CRISPR-associated protein Cmr5
MATKDQERAKYAYERVGALWSAYSGLRDDARQAAKRNCVDYEIAVRALGTNILRSGLSAALADLMRRKASTVLNDLAKANIPGIRTGANGAGVFKQVNELSVGEYMLATRETLQVVIWLKRACDALFDFDTPEHAAANAAALHGDDHAR